MEQQQWQLLVARWLLQVSVQSFRTVTFMEQQQQQQSLLVGRLQVPVQLLAQLQSFKPIKRREHQSVIWQQPIEDIPEQQQQS